MKANMRDYVIESLTQHVAALSDEPEVAEVGTVIEVGDGIAKIIGLRNCQSSEMLEFVGGTVGVALNLEEDLVGAVVLGDYRHIKEGDVVKRTGRILSIPVGEAFIGRVVDPLGKPIDGKGEIKSTGVYPI